MGLETVGCGALLVASGTYMLVFTITVCFVSTPVTVIVEGFSTSGAGVGLPIVYGVNVPRQIKL